jgi:hypothetical protein
MTGPGPMRAGQLGNAKLLSTTLLLSCRHSATLSVRPGALSWLLAAALILIVPTGSSVVGRPLSPPVADLNKQISGLSLAPNSNPRKVIMSEEAVTSTPGGIPIAEFIVSISVWLKTAITLFSLYENKCDRPKLKNYPAGKRWWFSQQKFIKSWSSSQPTSGIFCLFITASKLDLTSCQDLYSKYKFIETRLSQSKANLKGSVAYQMSHISQ